MKLKLLLVKRNNKYKVYQKKLKFRNKIGLKCKDKLRNMGWNLNSLISKLIYCNKSFCCKKGIISN